MEIKINQQANDPTIKMLATKCEEYEKKFGTNTIVLLEIGNRYETYNKSAAQLHTICKFPIIHYGNTATLDFKKDCDTWVFPKMIREGFKICIISAGTF